MAPENQILAAVVKFTTFLLEGLSDSLLSNNSPFNIIPVPKNPMPVTICAAILEVEFGSTNSEI